MDRYDTHRFEFWLAMERRANDDPAMARIYRTEWEHIKQADRDRFRADPYTELALRFNAAWEQRNDWWYWYKVEKQFHSQVAQATSRLQAFIRRLERGLPPPMSRDRWYKVEGEIAFDMRITFPDLDRFKGDIVVDQTFDPILRPITSRYHGIHTALDEVTLENLKDVTGYGSIQGEPFRVMHYKGQETGSLNQLLIQREIEWSARYFQHEPQAWFINEVIRPPWKRPVTKRRTRSAAPWPTNMPDPSYHGGRYR